MNDNIMKKLLVTGGAGFIGSNLSVELSSAGHQVVIVDDFSSARPDFDNIIAGHEIETVRTCFSSEYILDRIRTGEFSTVFHVAAIPRVSYSVERPAETTEVNVSKTAALLEACRHNIERFIFSSSSSVYGGADLLPTPATYTKAPKSPYAWQKSCVEDLIIIFCSLYDMDIVSLRYFNVFGPGQFGGSAYSTAISAWCHAIKNDMQLRKDGTGEQSRDMCYVDNVVSANVKAMNYPGTFVGERLNVACGDRVSNNEILDFLIQRFGKLDIKNVPFREGDVMHTCADISETAEKIGYSPLVRFWDGIEKTLDWWDLNE